MNYLDYFFYKFYKSVLFGKEANNLNHINAFLGLAAMVVFNIISVMFLFNFKASLEIIIKITLSAFLISYFLFIYRKRYLTIINKFNEHDPYPILGKVIFITYVVISFGLLIFTAWLERQSHIW